MNFRARIRWVEPHPRECLDCLRWKFLTLINVLDNYLPLVLTIYTVIFRSNNCCVVRFCSEEGLADVFCFGRLRESSLLRKNRASTPRYLS